LPQVDRAGEILRSPIIDETSLATDMLDGPRRQRLPSAVRYVRLAHLAPPSKKASIIPRTITDCVATNVLPAPSNGIGLPLLAWKALGDYVVAMCGRYPSFLPAEAIPLIFGTVNPLPNLAPRGIRQQPWTRQLSDCTRRRMGVTSTS
jgi:hypothetical protein